MGMGVIEEKIRSLKFSGVQAVAGLIQRMSPRIRKINPYASGIHRPMKEEKTLPNLEVVGEIPETLDGLYSRIGPNPITSSSGDRQHWFLGDGMMHGIRIEKGKASWYRNRWIRSHSVSKTLGEASAPGPRNSVADNANTNVIQIGGRFFATVEAGAYPVEIDEYLETIKHNPFDNALQGSFSAHPHLDPSTKELHAICYDALVKDTVWHVVVNTEAKVIRRESIRVVDGPSIHDCAITTNYVLVFDLPVTFSMRAALAGHGFPYKWNPSHRARVGLCPRAGRGEETVWFDVDPCYVFHPVNAFENPDGSVVVDVVTHDSMFKTSKIGPDSKKSRLERWTMNAGDSSVSRRVIHDHNQEFPRINEGYICKAHRYVYSVSLPSDLKTSNLTTSGTSLFKVDTETSDVSQHDFGPDRYPGEFVFISKNLKLNYEDVIPEDEGWLMGFVVDAARQVTELVILDAQFISSDAVAKIHIPHIVPPGFHGNWFQS